MTEFTSTTQTDDAETLSTARRAYIAPAITYASVDGGPEGKRNNLPFESTFPSSSGPS